MGCLFGDSSAEGETMIALFLHVWLDAKSDPSIYPYLTIRPSGECLLTKKDGEQQLPREVCEVVDKFIKRKNEEIERLHKALRRCR